MSFMNQNEFWQIVDQTADEVINHGAKAGGPEQCDKLRSLLVELSPEDVNAFSIRLEAEYAKACHEDLYLAVHVLQGGCGDDGFELFVKSLLATGSDVFYSAICYPDDTLFEYDWLLKNISGEKFYNTVSEVWEEKFGKLCRLPKGFSFDLSGKWFDVEDADELQNRAPKLWEKYSHLHV